MSGMKLVIAIVQDEDVDNLLAGLRDARFGATKISSTGGVLRSGNSALLIGVAAEQVKAVRGIIQERCRRRTQLSLPYSPAMEPGLLYVPERFEVEAGGAVVFVRSIERFEQF